MSDLPCLVFCVDLLRGIIGSRDLFYTTRSINDLAFGYVDPILKDLSKIDVKGNMTSIEVFLTFYST